MLGLSIRQLTYSTLIGAIKPRSVIQGSRSYQRYSEKDVQRLTQIKELISQGIPIGRAIQRIKDGDPTPIIPLSYFYQRLYEEEGRSIRFKFPMTCIVVRVRRSSDALSIQNVILSMKRCYDLLTRFDEHCFLWILLQSEARQAQVAVERMLKRIPESKASIDEFSFIPRLRGDGILFINNALKGKRPLHQEKEKIPC